MNDCVAIAANTESTSCFHVAPRLDGCAEAAGRTESRRMIRKLAANPYLRILAAFGFLVGIALGFVAWKSGVDRATLAGWWHALEIFLRTNPGWLFAGLVLLPGLPMPTSALLFLAGTVWKDHPAIACGICLMAMLGNFSWTYWLAAGPARKLVEKVLAASEITLPSGLEPGNQLRMILLLRLTPGIPLFFQNYLLGFFRVRFSLYLVLSFFCNGIFACGFVLAGAGFSDGNMMPLVSGIGLIVVGFVIVQAIRAKLRKPTAD